MMAAGALAEVEALGRRGLDPALPVMRAHGVPALLAHGRGEIGLEEAIAIGQADTRAYAKRQHTWFRHQMPGWTWVSSGEGDGCGRGPASCGGRVNAARLPTRHPWPEQSREPRTPGALARLGQGRASPARGPRLSLRSAEDDGGERRSAKSRNTGRDPELFRRITQMEALPMKLVLALAASLAATAAFAQSTTVIQRDAPSTTVIEKRDPTVVIEKRSTTETTGTVGCETTTQKRTDAVTGDTTTRERTNC
jgi:hypothetical protein